MHHATTTGRVLRLEQVKEKIKLSGATIWRRVKTDPDFPKPFHIGLNATAWDESEVLAWLESCKAKRAVTAS